MDKRTLSRDGKSLFAETDIRILADIREITSLEIQCFSERNNARNGEGKGEGKTTFGMINLESE